MDVTIIEITIIVLIAGGLFISEVIPPDVVSMSVLVSLLLLHVVDVPEAFSGFSNSATITVGAFFVITRSIEKTGVLAVVADTLARLAGRSSRHLLTAIVGLAASCSTFLHATGVVAVMLPVVLDAARASKESASRFLIPLSYAAQFGGVCTLVGTTSNILVSSILVQHRLEPIGMFEMTRLGIPLFFVGLIYLLTVGWWMIPARRSNELTEAYRLDDYLTELEVASTSSLVGKSLAETNLRRKTGLQVIEIVRNGERIWAPAAREVILAGDVLITKAQLEKVMAACPRFSLSPRTEVTIGDLEMPRAALIELLVRPGSPLVGSTLREIDFRERYDASVLALKRKETSHVTELRSIRLQGNDILLVQGMPEAVRRLQSIEDFVLLSRVVTPRLRRLQLPLVMAIVVGVVLCASIESLDLPVVTTSVTGAVLLLLLRVVSPEEAYEAINWRVLFLMIGIMPLGIALEKWHIAAGIAHAAAQAVGDNPAAVLSVVYFLTMVLTEFVTHSACAVLMTPIALSAALTIHADPRPFAIAVAFATSTSFSTPVGYQTNAMVYGPGAYRFADYARVGIPLNLLFWAVSSWLIPQLWSLRP